MVDVLLKGCDIYNIFIYIMFGLKTNDYSN